MKKKITITLTENMLGTKAANKEVFADYIASKAPDGDKRREELDTAEQREESGTTVFHALTEVEAARRGVVNPQFVIRENGERRVIGMWDYQLRGFFKEACGALRNVPGSLSSKLTAYKSRIDGLIFVNPRFIPIRMPEGGVVDILERPLRADTMQGPRVSLVRSETVPYGSQLDVEIVALADKLGKEDEGTGKKAVNVEDLVNEWLDYGALRGLGQWRNASWGRFSWSNVVSDSPATQ